MVNVLVGVFTYMKPGMERNSNTSLILICSRCRQAYKSQQEVQKSARETRRGKSKKTYFTRKSK